VATRQDLELARMLLSARVLTEDQLRAAFEQQGDWLRQRRIEPLETVLYERGDLPPGSLGLLSAPEPHVSQPFANYRLEGILGEGGSSTVYAGTYLPNGTPVAVKVLKPIHALRKEYLKRFQSEARLLTELDHENIVAGYETGCQGGWHFYTMDWIQGATVLEVIERRGHLTNEEALSILWQTARALEYLHAHRLLHRDIKPGNVMVEPSGRARLIDLGLVRRLGVEAPVEPGQEGLTVGTVEYLSPEQARGRADLDPRSDVYSLGVTLYHMVVGEVPFQGETDYEVMAKQIMASLDTQKVKQRRISPEVHFFVTKMMSKERESRYAALSEICRDVGGYLPGGVVPVDLGTPPSPARHGAPPPRVPPPAPTRGEGPPSRRTSRSRRRGR
jgi:serine/threonine-protein kinase